VTADLANEVARTVIVLTLRHVVERWHERERALADVPALIDQVAEILRDASIHASQANRSKINDR
jgi:hypothetical protein